MKRTDIERKEREVKRMEKRSRLLSKRKENQDEHSVGNYIDVLYGCFRYDDEEIFNTQEDLAILETLEKIQANLPDRKWDDVLRKAIKKTGVKQRERAFIELKELMSSEATSYAYASVS